MSLSEDLYKEIILEHCRSPSHRGHLENPTVVEQGVNRSCGDEVEIELLINSDKLEDIRVNGRGCSISTASGSLMADAVDGLPRDVLLKLIQDFKKIIVDKDDLSLDEKFEDLESLKSVTKFPVRVKCATLCWNTLEQALKNSPPP